MAHDWALARLPPFLQLHTDTCAVDKARNMLVAKARDAKCDWLLMCDADTYYPGPPAIATMLHEGNQRKAAVIAAPVRMRKRADGFNVKRGDSLLAEEDFRGRVVEVDGIGTAFMAVRLGWLVQEWPLSPWFEFKHHEGYQPKTTGEDYSFCQGVRQRGGLILADGRFEPAHVGATDESATLAEVGASKVDI